ncbi:MAG: hypothetical protein COT43_01445 [Candidatus Marinimicrobia bacterium CG08_land_8_20_14_0_20_45_22]|nr:MAG: hypothetical protein COT43_01445 [Candidatus Marinimicrobia bacterium CG08_land_8_20_14_0_20_45_22]
MKAYLAGAIEHASDRGEAWRTRMSNFLASELRHDFYNPLIEEKKYLTPDEGRQFRGLKTSNLQKFQETVRKLMTGDLKSLTTEIDYIICYWDEAAALGGGTYGELTFAFYMKIPVYMVTRLSAEKITGWVLGCVTQIFSDFAELEQFLKEKYRNEK